MDSSITRSLDSLHKYYASEIAFWEANGVEINGAQVDHYAKVRSWLGTPFKLGGKTRAGVDNIGFINALYKARGLDTIPLDKTKQNSAWTLVSLKQPFVQPRYSTLEADLLLFKTKGLDVDHIGLYLGGGVFAHASGKRGVTISKLDSFNTFHSKAFYSAAKLK